MHTQCSLRTSSFKQVDVFTSSPMRGNALAVVFDCEDLGALDMQRIAAWFNLSETTFVLPPTQPGADYRVRIFTPRAELGFAGHPSVGTAHALLEAERIEAKENLVQECVAGLLPLRIVGDGAQRRIYVRAPKARFAAMNAAVAATVTKALGAAPGPVHEANIGLDWILCDLGSERAVRALKPDMEALVALRATVSAVGFAVFGRTEGNPDHALVVRAFCPAEGIPEDPVTGSANAAIGALLHATGQLGAIGAQYRASQGREVGRDGYVDVRVDTATGDVEIGGQCVTCIDGMLALPHD